MKTATVKRVVETTYSIAKKHLSAFAERRAAGEVDVGEVHAARFDLALELGKALRRYAAEVATDEDREIYDKVVLDGDEIYTRTGHHNFSHCKAFSPAGYFIENVPSAIEDNWEDRVSDLASDLAWVIAAEFSHEADEDN